MTDLPQIDAGQNVTEQIESDLKLELSAAAGYNAAIQIIRDLGDNASRKLLERLLKGRGIARRLARGPVPPNPGNRL